MRAFASFTAVLVTLMCGWAAKAQPVAFPPDIAPYVPSNLRNYFIAFLRNPPQKVPMTPEVFRAHQDHMRKQVDAGHYKVMGPLEDNDAIRGVVILEASTIEEARTFVADDPAVRAGVFAVDIYPVVLPDLSPVVVRYHGDR